jgi:Ni/Fe-hydrogenase subunit HybB-like protein
MPFSKFPKFTFWRAVLVLILAAGAYSTYVRFFHGLGASTNLSDRFPWGIWIGFDVLCGVGTAAGGFTLAAVVYIFHLERFRPIIRPAILIAFLGYARVGSTMLFEVGRPIRIWYPLIHWNIHSVLFEVAWCVMLYVTVAGLEFSPVVLERLGWEAPKKALKAVMLPLVFAGILLSTMHQSSLGSLFLIVPSKLHPYWYSPLLPVFFIVSALGVGLALLILASHLSARAFGASIEWSIMVDLGKAMAVVMLLYATIRFQDLWERGTFHYLRQPTVETTLFLLEILVGVILPLILLAIRRVRENPEGLFASSVLVITGFLLNRLNVAVTGLEGWAGGRYFPRWTETAVSVSTVAAAVFAFGLAVRYLRVFEPASGHGAQGKDSGTVVTVQRVRDSGIAARA